MVTSTNLPAELYMWMLAGVGDSQSGSQTFWRKDDVTLPAGSRPAHFLDYFFSPSHSNMRSENKMAIQSDYQAGPLLKDYSFMLFSLMADVILQTDKEYTWVCRYSLIMIHKSDDYLQSESSHH